MLSSIITCLHFARKTKGLLTKGAINSQFLDTRKEGLTLII